jgi:hypothetical protein
MNKSFLPRFRGYEKAIMEWDISELPEMQTDMLALAGWLNTVPITLNEFREAMKYESLDGDGMDVVWVQNNKTRIDDISAAVVDSAFNKPNI